MEFRHLRALLTEDTKVDLVASNWTNVRGNEGKELLPKPVSRNDDVLKGFSRYVVTKVVPLDYEYVRVYLDPGVKDAIR